MIFKAFFYIILFVQLSGCFEEKQIKSKIPLVKYDEVLYGKDIFDLDWVKDVSEFSYIIQQCQKDYVEKLEFSQVLKGKAEGQLFFIFKVVGTRDLSIVYLIDKSKKEIVLKFFLSLA